MNPDMPKELDGIYDSTEYARQQTYQKESSSFDLISGGFSFVVGLLFLWYGGAGWLDGMLRRHIDNTILLPVIFFCVLFIFMWIISIPFDWYDTFVIEQKYGFNKTTYRTFAADEVKKTALNLVLSSVIISLLAVAYEYVESYSWLWAWIAVSVFTLTISYFYSEWIVPLFNKQTPLEEGELRSAIETFAEKVSFSIQNIYVIDGSKRSTKSNAYFTGFGKKKRVVLYDTLINDLNKEEIVAVLAHEIGHNKMRHVIYKMAISLSTTGFLLWALTLFLKNQEIAYALGGTTTSLHLALIGFSLLYLPLSEILNFASYYISRKHEYSADNFTAAHEMGEALVEALKKISSKSLSNLTPHPFVVFWNYSHPTLLQRMSNVQKKVE
jgi:STE24 endopeptidase